MAKNTEDFDFPQLRISAGKKSTEDGNRGEDKDASSLQTS